MYRFALRPKWIISHLLVAVLVIAMVWACLWQLSRRSDRQAQNERIISRTATAEQPVQDVLSADLGLDETDDFEYRRVTATGEWLLDDEVLVRNRPLDGAPGSWALTPLRLDADTAILVNRGWIPRRFGPDDDRTEIAPPGGAVTITGVLRPTELRRGLNVADPAEGVLSSVARPDIERLAQQIDVELLPMFVQLESHVPAVDLPAPVPLPELNDGPHLSYATQWGIFSLIAIVGYPLILRRVARGDAASVEEVLPQA